MSPVTPEPTPGPQACISNTLADPQAAWVPESLRSHIFGGGDI